jgi:ABC-type Fe3+-hydroxamate transport system substrate-binding protein
MENAAAHPYFLPQFNHGWKIRMTGKILTALTLLALAGCGGTPPANWATANDDPALKPPVQIITTDGRTFTCQAAPGAVCVQP